MLERVFSFFFCKNIYIYKGSIDYIRDSSIYKISEQEGIIFFYSRLHFHKNRVQKFVNKFLIDNLKILFKFLFKKSNQQFNQFIRGIFKIFKSSQKLISIHFHFNFQTRFPSKNQQNFLLFSKIMVEHLLNYTEL